MPLTPEQSAKRIDEALARLAALDELNDLLVEYRTAAIRHARTNSSSDYLDELQLEDLIACALERGLRWELCDTREILRDEARSECSYDLKEGCYLDSNGEPISPPASFGSRHPDDRGLGGRI